MLTLPDPDVVAIATAPSAPATTTTQMATMTARGRRMAPARPRRLGATGPPRAPSVTLSALSAGSVSACSMRSVMVPRPRRRPTDAPGPVPSTSCGLVRRLTHPGPNAVVAGGPARWSPRCSAQPRC